MAIFTVSTLNDSGVGSLRAAITAANADSSGTPTGITFSVSGTITLASALPSISQTVSIDGTSAPTHVSGGPPVVALNCNGNGGLVFATGADGSKLLGLAVDNASGNGVTLNAGTITLAGNYIGVNLAGAAAGNGGDGVFVSASSSGNIIGLNPTAASGVVSNVISANAGNGISFHGSSSNTLVNNYIGTDATGTVAMANGSNGIWLTAGSNGNEIGGAAFINTSTGAVNDPTGNKGTTTPVFVVPPLGNLVSGNAQNGILIDTNSRNNQLNGNFVGTTADGNSPLGNAIDGVHINGADGNALIGCTFVENPFAYYNVLSGNGANGLHITDSNNVLVQANFFGIGADNTTTVSNVLDGILVDGSSQNVQVGGVIPLGNVSAGNGTNGIEVRDTVSGFTTFNTFGGLLAFKGAAPNGNDGLLITATGGNQVVQTNVFSGNINDGIEIAGDASGVTVDPNMVGVNTVGSMVLSNQNNGLEIDGTAHNNIVGGHQLSVIPRNIFSGNNGYGIAIDGQAHDNQVINSYVGTNAQGLSAIGNQLGGILVGGTAINNTIGDVPSTPSLSNAVLISGNDGNGVTLQTGTSFTQILGDIIGFSSVGTPTLPNFGAPIAVNGSTNNTISGNQVFACFAAATLISTRSGDVAVENLHEGDLVLTLDGDAVPVRWIGHRRVDCRRHPAPAKVMPIRIAAHAFGRNKPRRDLFLSPDHAIYAEGVLIPIRYLVNGSSVAQVAVDAVTYFHIELPRHNVILANGLPTESYLDTGDRASFANSGETIALHPVWGHEVRNVALVIEAMGYAPLQVTGGAVENTRRMLAAKARRKRVWTAA